MKPCIFLVNMILAVAQLLAASVLYFHYPKTDYNEQVCFHGNNTVTQDFGAGSKHEQKRWEI